MTPSPVELEKGWPKAWDDIARGGVLPGVDAGVYAQRYRLNRRTVDRYLATVRSPVLTTNQLREVHGRLFAEITPWAGCWANQASIAGRAGSPKHRTERELDVAHDQARRLLAQVGRGNADHVLRVAAFQHARFLAIHPFPDGNGRISRILTEHFVERTLDAVKSLHPDKAAYVGALVAAIDTHNLAPLARHFQWELLGRAEALTYVPSPFRIPPLSLPAESHARELRASVREAEATIAAPALLLHRPWLRDARLSDLGRFVAASVPEAKAAAGFAPSRKLLEREQVKAMSLGEAVALLGQVRELKPYAVGLLQREVGREPFQRWAQAIFAPLLRALDNASRVRLTAALDAQLAVGTKAGLERTNEALVTAGSGSFVPPKLDAAPISAEELPSSSRLSPQPHRDRSLRYQGPSKRNPGSGLER